MATYLEKYYANGRVLIAIDGRCIGITFLGDDGQRLECHKQVAVSQDIQSLLDAGETDEFDVSSLAGWDEGPADLGMADES